MTICENVTDDDEEDKFQDIFGLLPTVMHRARIHNTHTFAKTI